MGLPWWLSSKPSACNAGDMSSITWSGRPPGEGNDNSLQSSCLGNRLDNNNKSHGVAKSQIWLSNQTTTNFENALGIDHDTCFSCFIFPPLEISGCFFLIKRRNLYFYLITKVTHPFLHINYLSELTFFLGFHWFAVGVKATVESFSYLTCQNERDHTPRGCPSHHHCPGRWCIFFNKSSPVFVPVQTLLLPASCLGRGEGGRRCGQRLMYCPLISKLITLLPPIPTF